MLTLLVGGARSGKSSLAVELGRRSGGPVAYVATCPRIDGDDDLVDRIDRHRAERPADWTTIEEELDLAAAVGRCADHVHVIVDCLTTWVANLQHRGDSGESILAAVEALIDVCARRAGDVVVVSNEVGLGIVPGDEITRSYRDLLGRTNQQIARRADRSLLLVAGRAIPLTDPWEFL